MRSFSFLLLLSTAMLAAPFLLHKTPSVLTGCFALIALGLFWNAPSRNAFIVFVVVSVAGTGAEIFAVQVNIMTFSSPDFLGAPLWLSFTWGNTALIALQLKEYLDVMPSRGKRT